VVGVCLVLICFWGGELLLGLGSGAIGVGNEVCVDEFALVLLAGFTEILCERNFL